MKIARVVVALSGGIFGLWMLYHGVKEIGSRGTGPAQSVLAEDIKKTQASFLLYDNPTRGVKIQYPQSWHKEEPKDGLLVVKFSTLRGVVNLNAGIEDLHSPMTLEAYSALTLNQIKEAMAANNTALKSLEEGAATLANTPAHTFLYTFTTKAVTGKGLQVLTLQNNKAYLLTYTAAQDVYDAYLGIIQHMLHSFEIISDKAPPKPAPSTGPRSGPPPGAIGVPPEWAPPGGQSAPAPRPAPGLRER